MKRRLLAAVAWCVSAASYAAAQGAGNAGAADGNAGLGWLWAVAIFIILIAIIAAAARGGRRRDDAEPADFTPPRDEAIDILKRRYAKGEISKAEFEEKKRDIEESLVGPRSR